MTAWEDLVFPQVLGECKSNEGCGQKLVASWKDGADRTFQFYASDLSFGEQHRTQQRAKPNISKSPK